MDNSHSFLEIELNRKLHTLSESLTEKAEENIFLQEQNKSLLGKIKELEERNNKLMQLNEKYVSQRQNDEIARLRFELDKQRKKNETYKSLITNYENEMDEIEFSMEERQEREMENKIKSEEENEIVTLRLVLEKVNKKISINELENDILKLRLKNEQQEKESYVELLESYKPKTVNKKVQYGKEDFDSLKLQLNKIQQKYLSQKESLKTYETQMISWEIKMRKNLNEEIKIRRKYAEEVTLLRNKLRTQHGEKS
jgi:chromosome segregation ATPase